MIKIFSVVLRVFKFIVKFILIILLIGVLYQQLIIYDSRLVHRHRQARADENIVYKEEMIYILIWSENDTYLSQLHKGQDAFVESRCLYTNCFLTSERKLLGEDYRRFDAVLLNGKNVDDLPKIRANRQMYVFASKESAELQPICNESFDNYFNLTFTYKVDSDAIWSFITIYNINDIEVGPRLKMNWNTDMDPVEEAIKRHLEDKEYTAIYYTKNCNKVMNQTNTVMQIKVELNKFFLDVNIVDRCRHDKVDNRSENLEKYYIYLSSEESLAEDYVTEDLLTAFKSFAIPVVFGSSDYNRFLPPKSYINAGKLGPYRTAVTIAKIIGNQTKYLEYFQWRKHYSYRPDTSSICRLCQALNRNTRNTYTNFRTWWNPKDYSCS